jgi:hypothetical protein
MGVRMLTSPGATSWCSAGTSPVIGSMIMMSGSVVVMVTWWPISRHGTE